MMTNSKISPDDLCGVCDTTREMHGDKLHLFTLDNQLIPTSPAPAPRQEAPKLRSETPSDAKTLSKDLNTQLSLRVIDTLTKKGIFNGEDLFYIFGGESSDSTRGQARG